MSIIDIEYLHEFLADHGAALGLDPSTPGSSTGIAGCWDQHPTAIHDLTGIALAWTALIDAFDPAPSPDGTERAYVVPAPRDWLDLTNATVAARDRIKSSTSTCARAGGHIGSPASTS